jgi:hypothetical protein
MTKLEFIQDQLSQVSCPLCQQTKYTVTPDRNSGSGEILCTGRCNNCSYTFKIYPEVETYLKTQPDVDYWLQAYRCMSCEQQGADLNFRCALSVRDTFYFLTCKSCGKHFYEKSFMETFE